MRFKRDTHGKELLNDVWYERKRWKREVKIAIEHWFEEVKIVVLREVSMWELFLQSSIFFKKKRLSETFSLEMEYDSLEVTR